MLKSTAPTDSKPQTGKAFLYVMSTGAGFAKVGIAKNPTARQKQLQTGNPENIAIKAVFGPFFQARKLESAIHKQLQSIASTGEWFTCVDQVMSAVEAELGKFTDGKGKETTKNTLIDDMRVLFGPAFDSSIVGLAMSGKLAQPSLLN